jgi:hypothetical protein
MRQPLAQENYNLLKSGAQYFIDTLQSPYGMPQQQD